MMDVASNERLEGVFIPDRKEATGRAKPREAIRDPGT
jgi:hypothetical protein